MKLNEAWREESFLLMDFLRKTQSLSWPLFRSELMIPQDLNSLCFPSFGNCLSSDATMKIAFSSVDSMDSFTVR